MREGGDLVGGISIGIRGGWGNNVWGGGIICPPVEIGITQTYPLSTPRTRLSMKKLPTTISGMKKTQLKALPIASLV